MSQRCQLVKSCDAWLLLLQQFCPRLDLGLQQLEGAACCTLPKHEQRTSFASIVKPIIAYKYGDITQGAFCRQESHAHGILRTCGVT